MQWANEDVRRPDVTLLLDIDPEDARCRVLRREGAITTFEERSLPFRASVRATFLACRDESLYILDAGLPPRRRTPRWSPPSSTRWAHYARRARWSRLRPHDRRFLRADGLGALLSSSRALTFPDRFGNAPAWSQDAVRTATIELLDTLRRSPTPGPDPAGVRV